LHRRRDHPASAPQCQGPGRWLRRRARAVSGARCGASPSNAFRARSGSPRPSPVSSFFVSDNRGAGSRSNDDRDRTESSQRFLWGTAALEEGKGSELG
jgi:hypothetical protein